MCGNLGPFGLFLCLNGQKCGTNSLFNYRLSHILSLILSEIWPRDRLGSLCMNTEEMMSDIALVNNEGIGRKTRNKVNQCKDPLPKLRYSFYYLKGRRGFS